MFLSKRNGVYHIFYTDEKGKRHSVSTKCKLKSEANKFLVQFSNELKKNKENGKTLFTSVTLERFCLEYLKYSDTVHTYWTNFGYKRTFGFFKGFFPDMYMEDFTPADISRYIEFRIKTSSKYQARKDLINLAAAFNWALLKGMIKVNPCKDIKKVKVPQKLPLFYSEEDFKKLMDVIDSEDIRDIVQFAVNTGLRQMELIKLEWYMVNFDKRIVILDKS